jgi:hypothetical protein
MAKDKIADYDGATAGNNTDIGGISIAEGMLPSAVNNSMRELTRQLGAFADGTEGIDVLNLHDDDASASIKLQAPATVTTTTTFTLPDGDGTSGYALVTNGSGQLSWASAGGIANVADDTTPQLGGTLDLNSQNITGTGNINITGSVTSDGLTVDGASVFNQAASDQSGGAAVKANGTAYGTNKSIHAYMNTSNAAKSLIYAENGAGSVFNVDGSGDISFYDSTGVTQGLFWDASTQRLGLGSTSPSAVLTVSGSLGTNWAGRFQNTSGSGYGVLVVTAGSTATQKAFEVRKNTSDTAMLIDGAGNVGIGVSTPSGKLHLSESGATNQAATIFSLDGYHSTFGANLAKSSGTYTTPAVSLSGGGWEYQPVNSLNGHGHMIYLSAPDTNSSAATPLERLRIDNSGNLLVSKTSASVANDGIQLEASGTLGVTRTNDDVAIFNRKSSEGNIAVFRKDNAAVGSIGTVAGDLYIANAVDVGLYLESSGTDHIAPCNISGAKRDAAIDLGATSARFQDAYFSGTVYADTFLAQNDTDTGWSFPAANQQKWTCGGAETFKTYQIAGAYGVLSVNGSGSATYPNFTFNGDDNTGMYRAGADTLAFTTGGSERARVNASGMLLVGKTANGIAVEGHEFGASGYAYHTRSGGTTLYLNRLTSDGDILDFRRSGTLVGSVSVTTSGTTYNTTSDLRLKENIEPLVATDKLMAMNPVSYNWKADPDGPRSMGFIAQEMQDVMPEAVAVGDDEDAMMSMDYGRITPILVSALQDAHRKIEQLEQRLADMESK